MLCASPPQLSTLQTAQLGAELFIVKVSAGGWQASVALRMPPRGTTITTTPRICLYSNSST